MTEHAKSRLSTGVLSRVVRSSLDDGLSLTRLVSPHLAFRPTGRYRIVEHIAMIVQWNEDKCTDIPDAAIAPGTQGL